VRGDEVECERGCERGVWDSERGSGVAVDVGS